MFDHAILLAVLIPIFSALLCVITGRRFFAFSVTSLCSLASLVNAGYLMLITQEHSVIPYRVGNWDARFGIELLLNPLNALLVFLIVCSHLCAVLYTFFGRMHDARLQSEAFFYALLSIFAGGLIGITVSNDIFNIFVFMEISSIAGYTLCSTGKDRLALLAAFDYLIIGTIGAIFYLIGTGLLYLSTGSLNLAVIAQYIERFHSPRVDAALVFMFFGVCTKAAVVPLHGWLTRVYRYAPTAFTFLSSSVTTKVYVLVMLKTLFVFFKSYAFLDITKLSLATCVAFFATLSIIGGAVGALCVKEIRDKLAYSSISQLGYILLGFTLHTPKATAAAVIGIVHHSLAKITLFIAASVLALGMHSQRSTEDRAEPRSPRFLRFNAFIAAASLIGVPGTMGFLMKFYLIQALILQQNWVLLLAVIGGSSIGVLYGTKIIEHFLHTPFLQRIENAHRPFHLVCLSITTVCASALLLFGLHTSSILRLSSKIVLFLRAAL